MKFFKCLLAACCLWLGAHTGHALETVDFVVSGTSKGSVPSITENNTTWVDVQKTARKLGVGVELFAQSKQAKVSAKGFYAILTAPLSEIILNAQPAKLSAPVRLSGGKILVPVDFFTLPAFQAAVGKEVSFKNNTLYVERRHNMSFTDKLFSGKDTQLVFDTRQKIAYHTEQPNAHTVVVTFENASLKRDLHLRLRTSYIASADMRQVRENTVLKVILGKEAKTWSMDERDGQLFFRAGVKAAPVLSEAAPKAVLKQEPPAPSTSQTAKAVQPEQTAAKGPSLVNEKPSVLLESEETSPVVKEAPAPAQAEIKPVAKTQAPTKAAPVLKNEPNPVAIKTAHKKMRIVVDPGHGGKDPGAIRSRLKEKDWNLAVGKELARLLKKAGFEVKLTRDNDTFVALSERSKIANNFKADLFVSVHTNASKNRNANGFQVYFRSEKATDKEAAETAAFENEAMQYEEVHYNFVDALLQSLAKNEYINESSKLAGYVRNAVYKQPGIGIAVNQNSSVRQANFYVLKGVNSPAVLVEMGYISSSKDRARLSNSAVRNKMALGIYNGVYNYAKKEGWIN